MTKDGKELFLNVYNGGTSVKKFSDCKVGTINCMFSSENDITINLPQKLSVTNKTTLEDVTHKFGDPTEQFTNEEGTWLRYRKDVHAYYEFIFDIEENKLIKLCVENWVAEQEEVVNEENDLSFLSDYVAPDALTDNYSDYIFRLEGDLYQFPAPVKSFLDNGWEIVTQPESVSGGGTVTAGLKMKKGENELTFSLKNFANNAVEIQDAMVIGVFIDSTFLEDIDFELSGGITIGMSISDFEAKSFASEFTTGTAVLGDIEYSYFHPSNRIYLTFKDDVLISTNFLKNTLNK